LPLLKKVKKTFADEQETIMKSYFFTTHCDLSSSATFGWQSPNKALLGVKDGYKNAADDLVEIALREGAKNHIRVLDTYIFPIMYLYRQSLEVSLKLIYHRCYGKIPQGKHDLIKLWDTIYEQIVVQHFENEEFLEQVKQYKEKFIKFSMDGIDFPKIRTILCELQQVDKQSDVWRYLVNKNGQLYFNQNTTVDYNNLKNTMDELYVKFDFIYTVISEYLSS
jgi:hypothetical protein